jgi:predicted branched-subunit amino acid permease
MHWREVRAGARAVAPMLVGVVPFGLVAGAAPAENGLGAGSAIGFSTIVFAGASQLAAIDVLGDGGSALVAAVAAWTINLRMLLYSASLAPHLAHESLKTRLGVAYLLTDQAYAVSITRWDGTDDPTRRVPYYLGAGLTLWGSWQLSTIVGAVIGPSVPEDVPLKFAVPLVFLVLLIPALNSRPAYIAAAVGGLGAVLAAEVGIGSLSLMVGALAGIAAGAIADTRHVAELPPPVLDVTGEPEHEHGHGPLGHHGHGRAPEREREP